MFVNLVRLPRFLGWPNWSCFPILPCLSFWPGLPGLPVWPSMPGWSVLETMPGLPIWPCLPDWPVSPVDQVCQFGQVDQHVFQDDRICQVCQVGQAVRFARLAKLPGLPDWLALLVWPICQVGRVCQACQVCQISQISQGARLGQARFWFYAENYRNDHQQLSNKNTLQCYRRPKTREPSVGIFYILGWLSVPPRRALFEQGSIWRLNYLHTFFSKCISVHVR